MENKNLCGAAYALNAQDMYAAFISPREISIEGKILLARQRVELFVDDFAEKLCAEYEAKDPYRRVRWAALEYSYTDYWTMAVRQDAIDDAYIKYWMPKIATTPICWDDIDKDVKEWRKAWMEDYEETRKQERKLFDIILGKPTKQQP